MKDNLIIQPEAEYDIQDAFEWMINSTQLPITSSPIYGNDDSVGKSHVLEKSI
jgi:hypothetical protein